MQQVAERTALPNQIQPGENATFLGWLIVALQTVLAEFGRRINLTAPKDGSEPVQMVSYSSIDLAMAADLDDGDPGYYAVVRVDVSGDNRILSGLVDGLAQEGVGGRVVTLMNVSTGAFNLLVTHEDGGSAAGNQFTLPRGLAASIAPEMAMTFWYDPTSLKWRVM